MMVPTFRLILGVLIGGLCAWGHLALLSHALRRVERFDSTKAARRLAFTLPLRVLCWTPALVVVALLGLWACLGLALGIAITRVIAVGRMGIRHGALRLPDKRG